jgi:hypothetical protein
MKIDFYTSAFNVIKNNFDYESAIENWLNFSNKIVIAINTSEDNTYEKFEELFEKYPNKLSIFKTNISYDDPDFDGKIKNEALQSCGSDIVLGLDLDERIPKHLAHRLFLYAEGLFCDEQVDCYMLPSIDIYKDIHHFSKVGYKWYLHKRKGCYRGTVNFAKNDDGTHDIEKSDSCELINKNGDLVRCRAFPPYPPRINTEPQRLEHVLFNNVPYIVHLGYLDLQRRNKLSEDFWKKQWEVESGKPKTMKTLKELESREVFEHKLMLDF